MDEGVEFVKAGLGRRPPARRGVGQRSRPFSSQSHSCSAASPGGRSSGRDSPEGISYRPRGVEQSLRSMYQDVHPPAIAITTADPDNFRLIFGSMLWASDKADASGVMWSVLPSNISSASTKSGKTASKAPADKFEGDLEELRRGMLIGGPGEVAERLHAPAPILPL